MEISGDLWDSSSSKLNQERIDLLAKYMTGGKSKFSENVDATKMRESSTDGKPAGKDIVVTLGGLKWEVVYLSQSKAGDPIVTLWLTNNEQDAWQTDENIHKSDAGDYYGFALGPETNKYGLYSDWSADWYADSYTLNYISNMYGISYIRAVTLNNGGMYVTANSSTNPSNSSFSTVTAEKKADNVFAEFTIEKDGGLTDFLVKPSQVLWQENQSAKATRGHLYNLSNDAWSQEITDSTGFYKNNSKYNYSGKDGNDVWANDYLWLPSIAETGSSSSTASGLWKLSTSQRQNYDSSTKSVTVSQIGTTQNKHSVTAAITYAWLRSAYYSHSAYALILTPKGDNNYVTISSSCAVRPALHLNLKSAALKFMPKTWDDYAASSYDSGSGTATSPYIIKTAEQFAKLAKDSRTSNMSGVFFKLGADIDLSAHAWYRLDTFNGTFTGDFHTITGMNTVYLKGDYRSGLFGNLGGVIDGLILTNGIVFADGDGGAIANVMSDTAVISNCIVDNVDIMDMGEYQDSSLGGIATYGPGSIINCIYKNGSIISTNSGSAIAGIKPTITGGEITNCVVQNVTLKNDDGVISGVCADIRSGSVNACFSEANIAAKGKVERLKTIIGTSSDFSDFFYNANLNGGYPIPKTLLSLGSVDIPSATIYNALIAKGFKN